MTERLLQFIWQFQYFNNHELQCVAGEKIEIVYPGRRNTNQGPDFLEARLVINGCSWAGNIELHVQASDWKRHFHDHDPNYGNLILHVVWKNDIGQLINDLPTLVLESRIPGLLLSQYRSWMNTTHKLPCSGAIHTVDPLTLINWKERLFAERLARKSMRIRAMLAQTNHHWDEVLWWLIARAFGLPVNGDAFEEMGRSLPLKILLRHRNHPDTLESLLLGQTGLLDREKNDPAYHRLKSAYLFYSRMYRVKKITQPVHFLRMRPASFPDVRLKKLAGIIPKLPGLFAFVRECANAHNLRQLFSDTIIINAIAPLVYTFASHHRSPDELQQIIDWFSGLPPEKNAVTHQFSKLSVTCNNAVDSQALLELKTQYCDSRRCLDCAIGYSIIRKSP